MPMTHDDNEKWLKECYDLIPKEEAEAIMETALNDYPKERQGVWKHAGHPPVQESPDE